MPSKPTALRVLNPAIATPPPGEYALAGWLMLVRVGDRIERRLAALLAEHDLTPPHFDVLVNLGLGEGITQQDLAERLLVTKGNVCVILDKLGKSGLVDRRPDPVDRRANRLYLTPDGRRLLNKVRPIHLKQLKEIMAPLPEDDQKQLFALLSRLDVALREAERG